MTRRPWFEPHDVAAGRRADRLAGREVGPHVWREDWAPLPVNRSVHVRPAETPHPSPVERAREAIASRVDTAIARSVGWLLSRSGLGR